MTGRRRRNRRDREIHRAGLFFYRTWRQAGVSRETARTLTIGYWMGRYS